MPRWPGLHVPAGALPAWGTYQARVEATDQRDYWRQTATELFAGANAVLPPQGVLVSGSPVFQRASAGPTAAGERWSVRLVQVQLPGLPAAPLVTLQQAAQAGGSTVQPPPPFVAQAWLSLSGVKVHLLAQTTQGGYDTMDLGGQVLTPGEQIAVFWWSTLAPAGPGFPGLGWMSLKGTRYALSAE